MMMLKNIFSGKCKVILSLILLLSVSTSSLAKTTPQINHARTYAIHYPNQVNLLLQQINPQNMWNHLITLTQFPDRSAYHESGVAAAKWIQSEISAMIKTSGRQDVSIFIVDTIGNAPYSGFPFQAKQPSIVVKIGRSSNSGIVLGAHFDTLTCLSENGADDEGCLKSDPLPGANDDGSGIVTLLEIAKILFDSNMQFNKPIYLNFYAAEESGLYGSTAVVDYFKKNNIAVDAVLQLDQTGFAYKNESTMYLETNKDRRDKIVDDQLTHYLAVLINTYVKKPVQFSCGGSSDEETWTLNGFVAARPLESDYCGDNTYPYAHKTVDTVDKISLTHMTDYLKLALAFTVELAEPRTK